MRSIVIPGPAWGGLIALLIAWLNQYFGDYTWTATAVVVLTMVAKLIEMHFVKPPQPELPPGVMSDPSFVPAKKPNPVMRFLVGA